MEIFFAARRNPPSKWTRQLLGASGELEAFESQSVNPAHIRHALIAYDRADPRKRAKGGILLLEMEQGWYLMCGLWIHPDLHRLDLHRSLCRSLLRQHPDVNTVSATMQEHIAKGEIAAGMRNIRCTALPNRLMNWFPLFMLLLNGNPHATLAQRDNRLRQLRLNDTAYKNLRSPWTYTWNAVPPYDLRS